MRQLAAVSFIVLALAAATAAAAESVPAARPALAVVTDFPGGSAEVVSIDQANRLIRIKPVDHPDHGWRVWWYFKVTGVQPGESLAVEVIAEPFGLPDHAAVSSDDRRWTQTAPGARIKGSVTYRHKAETGEIWFAWGPPYLPRDAADLIARAEKACPQAKGFEFCRTLEGHPVPAFRLSPPEGGPAKPVGLWIQGRQHAWEAGGSWIAHGLAEWLISDDPQAAAVRKKTAWVFVPIMDLDNVVRGAGGKNEAPRDHNRDWDDSPHWRSVQAAQRGIKEMAAADRFAVFLDLHNPGPNERESYFYTSPRDTLSPLQIANLDAFLHAALAEVKGPPPFSGVVRESGPAYDKDHWRDISKNWVSRNSTEAVSVTYEAAWNTLSGTQDGYRQVGRQLGMAIERYLRNKPE
ncbi:MAG: M14-type cytosolic carboxypeptidase [Planctomycetota bacterium]|nr:M14-type cytosolic carboxypeptidase [Planctomycetota bacterium]